MDRQDATPNAKRPTAAEEDDHFAEMTPEDLAHFTGPKNFPDPCSWCGGRSIHAELCITRTDAFQPKLGFGKHRNVPVRDVPADYLCWALDAECSMSIEANQMAIEVVRTVGVAKPEEIARWEARLAGREADHSSDQ